MQNIYTSIIYLLNLSFFCIICSGNPSSAFPLPFNGKKYPVGYYPDHRYRPYEFPAADILADHFTTLHDYNTPYLDNISKISYTAGDISDFSQSSDSSDISKITNMAKARQHVAAKWQKPVGYDPRNRTPPTPPTPHNSPISSPRNKKWTRGEIKALKRIKRTDGNDINSSGTAKFSNLDSIDNIDSIDTTTKYDKKYDVIDTKTFTYDDEEIILATGLKMGQIILTLRMPPPKDPKKNGQNYA